MSSSSKVYFFFDNVSIPLKKRTSLKSFIEGVFKKEKTPLGSINYIFCSDKRLLQINKDYLKHDYYTDIISFDLSSSLQKEAEIYISVDRVRENALKNKKSFNNELHRVIFHGALHICGYKDKKSQDAAQMRLKEDHYLKLFGFRN